VQPVAILDLVTYVTFVVAGIAAFRIWWRRRQSPAARWLLATFVVIDLVIVSTVGLPEDAELPRLLTLFILTALLAFPWCLFRFADALTGTRRIQVRLVTTVTAIVVAWGLVLPDFPESGEALDGVFVAYLFALLGSWALGTGLSAWRLFRAGKGQPGVIRNRMRLLGAGSLLLTLTLLVSSFDVDSSAAADTVTTIDIVAGVITLMAAWAFLAGFAPPSLLRAWWRRDEDLALHRASTQLMTAESPTEVASIVLPPFGRLVGADALVLVHGDSELGSVGSPEALDAGPVWRRLEISSPQGGLGVRAVMSATAPLLGQEELKVAERLLVIASLAVDRAQRARDLAVANEELESFVYSASHDLKNPLIAMLGYIDLLKNFHPFEPGSDPEMFLQRIDANGWFMSSLIDDLLELSRVGRVDQHPEPVEMADAVSESRLDVIAEFPTLRVTVDSALPIIRMSPTRARQLVTNILSNAGRHAGENAEVVISVEGGGHDALRVVFHDDGPGIDPSHAERIFRPFERLESGTGEGNGIGLAICRKIAQSLGGSMFLEPSEAGARFVVTFPSELVLGRSQSNAPGTPNEVGHPPGADDHHAEEARDPDPVTTHATSSS